LQETHSDTPDIPGNPATLARDTKLSTDPAVTVIGSAPTELATGKAAAAKLKEFSGLQQKLTGYTRLSDDDNMGRVAALMGHVDVTFKVGGTTIVVPYRVMVVTISPGPGGGGGPTYLAVLHYSIPK